MIARTQTARLKLLSGLRHSVIVTGALFLVAAGSLGVEIVIKNRGSAAIEHQNSILSKQIEMTRGEVDRANRLAKVDVPTNLGAVGKLQSAIEKMAADRKCSVIEFRASSEVSPYLTRFAKTNNVTGWGQVEMQLSLSGKAKNVVATLSALADTQIPYEFDTLEMTRDKVNEVGDATIIGHATLRVLIRTAKEAA